MSDKKWFMVTTWNAVRMEKPFMINRIAGHIIGVVIRLPDGQSSNGQPTYHSVSIGRYCRRKH